MIFQEVTSSLYAWDLLDEGTEPILDVLQEHTLTNSTYLVALMHDEKRPLTDYYYPHNPKRKVYWTEDSRAYWNPNPDSYARSRIKPRLSDRDELRGHDWLQELIDASRRRGMTVGAELSHTWIDKERTQTDLVDCVQRDIRGNPIDQQVCFNNPDVREYARALYLDLATGYDVDFIMTCVRGFNPGPAAAQDPELRRLTGITLGGCFCEHCRRKAEAHGIDWPAMIERLNWIAEGYDRFNARQHFELSLLWNSSVTSTGLLADTPELYQFLKFRCDSITDFFAEVRQAVKDARPGLDLRLNHYSQRPELMGLDLRGVAPLFDSVRSSDYSEQSGNPARMEWKRSYLHSIRRAIGVDKYFLSAVSPRPQATPDLVRQGVLISAQCGADALTIGHYDGSWMPCLRAVREGLEDAGIEVRRTEPAPERPVGEGAR